MVDSSDNIDTATNEKNQHAGPLLWDQEIWYTLQMLYLDVTREHID